MRMRVSLDEKRRQGNCWRKYESTTAPISIYFPMFLLVFAWKSPAGRSSVPRSSVRLVTAAAQFDSALVSVATLPYLGATGGYWY